MSIFECRSRRLLVEFTCGRCGKTSTEPYELQHKSTEGNLQCYDVRVLDEIHIRDLAAMIENRTKNNLPIPLRYVIKYNTLLEERYNGET